MYAYRKPFTVATFSESALLGIDYKIWLVIAQTLGYTFSKFYGIGFIGALKKEKRAQSIIQLIAIAWVALLFFALIPSPYNIIFLFINGIPLGIIYGLVFSYLEGRRATELLGAVLAASFIFASGLTQSVGKYLMLQWSINEWWMPWVTGLIFFAPVVFFTWSLNKTPEPDEKDIQLRTQRKPMSKTERQKFIKTFFPGLILLIVAYIILTIIRDYRSNFAADIWKENGYGNNASVFTTSELPASLIVLSIMGLMVYIKNNIRALLINHIIIIVGFLLALCATILFVNGMMPVFWWMVTSGIGLYMGYVPFNCMLFERLIASFKYVSNAGFIIYVADSFGYLGSDVILLVKNFMHLTISWTGFYVKMVLILSVAGIMLVLFSAAYFHKKYNSKYILPKNKLTYA